MLAHHCCCGAKLGDRRLTRLAPHHYCICHHLVLDVSYPSGQIGFIVATKGRGSCKKPVRNPVDESVLKYYTSEIHEASFVLPAFAKRAIDG